jgi:HEAT repeat protein
MILGGKGDAASRTKLHTVATSDPSSDVRVDAIGYLGRVGGDDAAPALAQILASSSEDDRVQRAAVRALGRLSGARARAAIRTLVENSSATERLRLEALSTFDQGERWGEGVEVECENNICSITGEARADGVTSDASMRASGLSSEEAAWLRGLYPRLETVRLKSRAASVLVRATDDASITWLMALVQKDDEPADVRASVLARMGRSLSIAQLGRLYDTAADRTVRRQIVSTLGQRTESEATDKLIQIVRTGTDPQLRRSAISALTRKNDPRTTQLLLEMIDR